MTQQLRIVDFLAERGQLIKLPGVWKRYLCAHGFFRLGSDHARLLAELQENFATQALMEAGVVVVDQMEVVSLHPSSVRQDAILYAAHGMNRLALLDAVSDEESLNRRPLLSMFSDYRATVCLEDRGNDLLVAFSHADVAILRTMGFPTALATGLDDICGKQLDAFCRRLGLDRRQFNAPNAHYRPREVRSAYRDQRQDAVLKRQVTLVFVGWSPATLDLAEPTKLAAVKNHFKSLHKNLGVECDLFRIWRPTEDALERVRICVRDGDKTDTTIALADSMDSDCKFLLGNLDEDEEPRQSYADLVQALLKTSSQSGHMLDRLSIWDRCLAHQERELIGPLLDLVQQTPDPIERGLVQSLADLSRLTHPQALLLASNYSKSIRESGANAAISLPREEIQQLLSLVDRVRAVTQELQPWRSKNSIKRTKLSAPMRPTTSARNSGSA